MTDEVSKEGAIDRVLVASPNPNTGTFEVSFYLQKNKKANLSVVDIKGISCFERAVIGKGQHKEKVALSSRAAGTFIVTLRKDNGTESKKVIVIVIN